MSFNTQSLEWCESQDLQHRVTELIKPALSVLDVGCGIRPQQFITPELLVCIEPHLEYIEILKRNLRDANALIIPLDALTALRAFPDRSIDSIFLIDVIEHMYKEVGAEVIRECERVARLQVVLFTPLGFMPQETLSGNLDGWNLHGGDWQDHKSGWYPEDFPSWNVLACKNLHSMDVNGRPINPPYGGFYAIKNIPKVANYFNDVYVNEVIRVNTGHLDKLHELFPQFEENIVRREMLNSNLKCGIKASQRTTELFIDSGISKSSGEIMELVSSEKAVLYLAEARIFNAKLTDFASQFLTANSREATLAIQSEKCAQREAEIALRETVITQREVDIAQREVDITQRELEFKNGFKKYNKLIIVNLFHRLMGIFRR